MSSPANPLAKYRSYSYYHVLALCDSTKTATELAKQTSLEAWQHATPGTTNSQLGPLAPKKLEGAGEYSVLINGSTDASFAITKASWTTATGASATKDDRNTSIAIEGNLSISEPKGIIFLDRVVRACIELGVDSANAVWVLKTFFVGYTVDSDNTEGHDHITDIDPLMFIAIDVTGTFSEEGGMYEISFVSVAHGQARLPQYARSGRATNFKVGNTLKDTFDNLTTQVQNNYDFYFKCVQDQVNKIDPSGNTAKTLRKVKYIIEAVPPYDNKKYTVTDQPIQVKTGGTCGSNATARIDANSSIETGIHYIMSLCSEVKKEMSEGIDGIKYQYQIHTAVASEKNEKTGETEFSAIYRVKQTIIPHSLSLDMFSGGAGSEISDSLKENIVTFEYIYTGKNIDVLELDMKLSMGLVYLQAATSVNSYKSTFNEPTSNTAVSNKDILSGTPVRGGAPIANIPVYFGSLIKAPNSRETNDSSATIQSTYNMAKHSSIEMIDSSMKISGNPLLLSSVNRNSSPDQVNKDTADKAKTPDDMYPGWGVIPSFAKIHIKMPRNNSDLLLFQQSSDGSDYAIDFWFQGYYYIIGINHVFDSGEFTQTLEMLSIPEKTLFSGDKQKESTATLNKEIKSCYDNDIPCINSQNKQAVALPENRWGSNTQTQEDITVDRILNPSTPTVLDSLPGKQDKNAISDLLRANSIPQQDAASITNNVSPSDFKGWDSASPDVRQAIEQASKSEGVDATTLAQFASIESSFNPNAVSSTGGTGLFQFSGGTWKAMGMKGIDRKDPNANAIAGARYIKQNQIGLKKALGRDPTVGELYLAHNQGLGGAQQIIRACETGDDSHISPAVRENMSKQFKGAGNMSGCEFKNWADTFVLKKYTKGIPHVPHITQTAASKGTQDKPKTRTAKEALGASKNCTVESTVKTDDTKKGCEKQPATAQDEKNSISRRTDDVPQIDKSGNVSMTGQKK